MNDMIVINHQETWDLWVEKLYPFDPLVEEDGDIIMWYDLWLNWVMGSHYEEGSNDQEYYYPFSGRSCTRLLAMEIPFEIRERD